MLTSSLKRGQGFILITVMLLLGLITLWVSVLLQQVLLYAQTANQMLMQHDIFHQLEVTANAIITSPFLHDCTVNFMDPNEVKSLVRKHGCIKKGDKQNYYYLIDDLGLYPCLHFSIDGREYSSQHWLLTIMSLEPRSPILQIRTAKPSPIVTCNFNAIQLIHSEIISWRYLLN